MGFLAGRVTFTRCRVMGRAPRLFGPEQLDQLAAYAIGRQRAVSADGVEVGWGAGGHVLDTRFELAKNIINDTLHFALRVDVQKIPADLKRAYYQLELDALAADNPSGRPSARQRQEARDAARDRLDAEARDGRFVRRKTYPLLWDAQTQELLVGTTAQGALERLHALFEKTFGCGLEVLSAGRSAFLLAEARTQGRGVDDARPGAFIPALSPRDAVAWQPDEARRDFLGNEFLLWLWYVLDTETDTIPLSDQSAVTVMLARTLVLECPRGQTGRETITSDGPAQLPEARRAIEAGKLPRKAGLILVRHDKQYELTLHAELLAVTGAKLPPPEEEDPRARLEERIRQVRHLVETLDLLYDAFLRRRIGSAWARELPLMQAWLQPAARPAAPRAATG